MLGVSRYLLCSSSPSCELMSMAKTASYSEYSALVSLFKLSTLDFLLRFLLRFVAPISGPRVWMGEDDGIGDVARYAGTASCTAIQFGFNSDPFQVCQYNRMVRSHASQRPRDRRSLVLGVGVSSDCFFLLVFCPLHKRHRTFGWTVALRNVFVNAISFCNLRMSV